jgi:exopolysaccharide biosynthesis protein
MQITLSTIRENDTDIYVVDVQVSSVAYLKTAFAQNAFGRNLKDTTSDIAEANDAILAINGDYYGFRDAGYVLRNGVLYRDTVNSDTDALVVGSDGSLYAASESSASAQSLADNGAWQILSFGPVLVQDGQVAVDTNTEVGQAKTSNPRTAIGMISPLHYVIVVSDGRTSASAGLSLYELAQVFQEQGCTFAYNLDGGGSSTLWFNGQVINNPTDGRSGGEREVSDIVYFG